MSKPPKVAHYRLLWSAYAFQTFMVAVNDGVGRWVSAGLLLVLSGVMTYAMFQFDRLNSLRDREVVATFTMRWDQLPEDVAVGLRAAIDQHEATERGGAS